MSDDPLRAVPTIPPPPPLPHITQVDVVARSRLFTVERVQLTFSNGVAADFERLPGGTTIAAVLIVPLLDADTVLLIREYAVGLERYELALPKGRAEPGESLSMAANRELMEEVKYGATQFTPLKAVSMAPNYVGHRTQIVLAEGLYPAALVGDEPEPLDVIPWPLSALEQLAARDDCTEARSLLALYLARDHLQQRRR